MKKTTKIALATIVAASASGCISPQALVNTGVGAVRGSCHYTNEMHEKANTNPLYTPLEITAPVWGAVYNAVKTQVKHCAALAESQHNPLGLDIKELDTLSDPRGYMESFEDYHAEKRNKNLRVAEKHLPKQRYNKQR